MSAHSSRRNRGRAAVGLLLGLVAIAGLGVWLTRDGAARARDPLVPEPQPAARSHAPPPISERMADLGDPTVRDAPPAVDEEPLPPRTYRGRGILAGKATVEPGTSFPERWTLLIEPSRALLGKENAVRREVEMQDGASEFEVVDLPLGGYSLRASAPRMNGIPVDVALFDGQERAYVVLRMKPAGFIDGGVFAAGGEPVQGLEVVLERDQDKQRVSTTTDYGGSYVFEDVLDGEYTIYFGAPENPLVPARKLQFQAPSLRFPRVEIPRLAEARIRVVDAAGRTYPDILVRGYGTNGGTIEARSDADGIVHARFLADGEYRLSAFEGSRMCGQAMFAVESTHSIDVDILFEP